MRTNQERISSPERLAYWYFRLNGFLTTENFIVHPELGAEQRTDADLLAVRFGNRAELPSEPMPDDDRVSRCATETNVIIAESKFGKCALNGPWTNRRLRNLPLVLAAIGCVRAADLESAADALYESGRWSGAQVTVRLFALGEERDRGLPIDQSQQLTWSEVTKFCVVRFRGYPTIKSAVGQWSQDGQRLRDCSLGLNPEKCIRYSFGLRANPSTDLGA